MLCVSAIRGLLDMNLRYPSHAMDMQTVMLLVVGCGLVGCILPPAMDAQAVILLALGCALVGWGVWRLTRKN